MIKAFKFRAQAIFSLLEKTHPPDLQNLSKLRAISNLFRFFYTPCILLYPFLTYGVITWGITYPTTLHLLFVLQKKAIRLIIYFFFI